MFSVFNDFRDAFVQYKERPFLQLFVSFFRGLNIVFFVKEHRYLSEVVKPLRTLGIIRSKIYYLYLYESHSLALDTRSRLRITINHYLFLQQNFSKQNLDKIYADGLICWQQHSENGFSFKVILRNSAPFEQEGFLSLFLVMNGVVIYTFGFSFARGDDFALMDHRVIYVTRIQGAGGYLNLISACTKHFKDNAPPAMMMSILEGMGLAFGVTSIVGVATTNQMLYRKDRTNFQKSYNGFWDSFDAAKIKDGDSYIPLPLKSKDIKLIKKNHRKRTVIKRRVRKEISLQVKNDFLKLSS